LQKIVAGFAQSRRFMMKFAAMITTSAALAMAGCSGSESANKVADKSPTAQPNLVPKSVPPTAPESATSFVVGAAPSRAFMIGKWAMADDCKLAIGFRPDGTVDGPFQSWSLTGANLSIDGDTDPVTLKVLDKDSMESNRAGSPPHRIIRC
jgi:hypothetical protein